MEHAESSPSEARCLTCGYLLRGLSEPVCPECGRAFDPADESTFDTRPPRWRRRRWIKRGAVALGFAMLYFAVGPRGVMRGEMTCTCVTCLANASVRRLELRPPKWVPLRYPGLSWRGFAHGGGAMNPPCRHETVLKTVEFGNNNVVRATGRTLVAAGSVGLFDGVAAAIDSAGDDLKDVMSPSSFGHNFRYPLGP